jgi:DNA-binding NarL/FixJ family response regulator
VHGFEVESKCFDESAWMSQKYQNLLETMKQTRIECERIVTVMAINVIDESVGSEPRKLQSPRSLAPREREVLDLLSKGRAYKQIADEMDISMGTIRTYIRRLYGKLNVNCRTEAVVLYLTQSVNFNS